MFLYAHQFANASEIVVAAPMWDLSFPALLKTFIEHINVGGIVFKYSDEGKIVPLCKAKTLSPILKQAILERRKKKE